MPDRILVVDDEKPIADILRFNLEREGYEVRVAYSGPEAIGLAETERPSLVILDIMLPRKDGFHVCQEIRSRSSVPILMLTAKDGADDKLRGFELGADDYVTKPFNPRELVARVRAILRRGQGGADPSDGADPAGIEDPAVAGAEGGTVRYGDLVVDFRGHAISKGGVSVDLTVREFALLRYLLAHPGMLLRRETLLSEVWGYEYFGDMRTVDVTVRRLREKIEDNPSEPRYILTRRGLGYLLARL